jgi:Spy/CpxP family protein refolding chaperone
MQLWLKRSFAGVFGASALLGGVTACSYTQHRHGDWLSKGSEEATRFKGHAVDKIAARLALDAAQKAKLVVLADRLQEQRLALRGGTDPRSEIASLVADETFDRWHAQDLVNAKLQAVRDKSPQLIAAMAEFYDGLTPDQQQKVRQFLQRSRASWQH